MGLSQDFIQVGFYLYVSAKINDDERTSSIVQHGQGHIQLLHGQKDVKGGPTNLSFRVKNVHIKDLISWNYWMLFVRIDHSVYTNTTEPR